MTIKEIIRLPDPRKTVKIELREVIRDVVNKPHLFVRARLSGWHFPERALEPFLVIGTEVSKFVLISNEGSVADAYFEVELPAAKRVSFGYGNIVSWDFNVSVDPKRIERLDRKLIPKGFIDIRR